MKRVPMIALLVPLAAALVLPACAQNAIAPANIAQAAGAAAAPAETAAQAAADSAQNTPPTPLVMHREGQDVYIEMTAQVTNIEISKGVTYNAWTFNGTVPGPVLHVKEGDRIHFTLKNLDKNMQHSMDMHAVHTAPSQSFIDVMPGEQNTFTYPATTPGVFLYHCGTQPVLAHMANGMYGTIIVDPKDGYPTDQAIDKTYTIVQSEWYKEHDMNDFMNGTPTYVVFNGTDYALKEHPLLAKVGDKVRIYVENAGPNEVSSFHIVGTTMDRVYLDGNPKNVLYGMQTVLLPASGGAVVEVTVTEAGDYPIVTHQFNDATKGAVGILRVTPDGNDNGMPPMGH